MKLSVPTIKHCFFVQKTGTPTEIAAIYDSACTQMRAMAALLDLSRMALDLMVEDKQDLLDREMLEKLRRALPRNLGSVLDVEPRCDILKDL